MTLYREVGTLNYIAPSDFSKTLDFVDNFGPNAGEQQIAANALTKAIILEGYILAFRVAQENDHLRYELLSEHSLPTEVQKAALTRISFYLSLDDDLAPFYAIGMKDPCFAPIIDRLYGMHHVKF